MIEYLAEFSCDICGRSIDRVSARGVRETRSHLKARGWKYAKVGDGYADWCPDCVTELEKDGKGIDESEE